MRTRQSSTLGTLCYLLAGLLMWGIQFTFVYVVHTLMCRFGAPPSLVSGLVLAITGVAVLVVLAFLVWQKPTARLLGLPADVEDRATYDFIARLMAVLGMAAVIWTGLTAFLLSACA
ncbi:hypothetical protein [Chelativorans xinjiangense]|uniref:hypothetical protein n=1 Tax=Chelativorans xinjiangense TaxID=2681485 RepID=UPI00135B2CBA|nr:hypothetical protein [Chelativorans xinjiangense]